MVLTSLVFFFGGFMEKYYKTFDDYVSNYNLEDKDIKIKYEHSYRVMELSKKYSKLLGFSEEEQELATLIGLLHDIGRFEQLRVYHTYNDSKSIDHADYGVKILFEDGLIKKFWDKEEDYDLIKFSVQNHNKLLLPEINNERIIKQARLIRDTDKLDILYIVGKLDLFNFRTKEYKLSKEVIKSVKEHKAVSKELVNNLNDDFALMLSFAFDINYDIVLDEVKENLKGFMKTINTNGTLDDVYKEVIKYIDERVD